MATKIKLQDLGSEIENRILRKLKTYDPKDPKLRETLLRIGFLLENEIKMNIRRKGIVDTGRLLNSIRSEFYSKKDSAGISIGSFGVPYAQIHEFGGEFTERQRRAMFASLSRRGKLEKNSRKNKNVIQGNRFRARPYIRPAVTKHKRRIVELLRELIL